MKHFSAFPKVGTSEYTSFLKALVSPFSRQVKLASPPPLSKDQIVIKAFCDELHKLAFGADYMTAALKGAVGGEIAGELSNRALYGEQAKRSPLEIAKDTGKSLAIHAPLAAAAHYGSPALAGFAAAAKNPIARGIGNFGAGTLNFMKSITSPIGQTGFRAALPVAQWLINKI